MEKKVRIEFDINDKNAIMRMLELQHSAGYRLKKVSDSLGIMTFEATYENVQYAIRRRNGYGDGVDCPEVEGWIACGNLGKYRIFIAEDRVCQEYPVEEIAEEDIQKKKVKREIFSGVFQLLLTILAVWMFCGKFFDSMADLYEMQLTDIMEPLCLILGIILVVKNISNMKKSPQISGNISWFRNYVLPWIMLPLVLAGTIVAIVWVLNIEEAHPAKEVPLEAPLETAVVQSTLLGKIISAEQEFLYIAYSEAVAEELYQEALYGYWENGGRWCRMRPFLNYNTQTEFNVERYQNIDRAMLLEAKSEYYDLNTTGVIVLKGNKLYGIAFEHETTSWEEIVSKISADESNE